MGCSICLNDEVHCDITTSCNHSFHKECLDKWLDRHDTCAYCRTYLGYSMNAINYYYTDSEDDMVLARDNDVGLNYERLYFEELQRQQTINYIQYITTFEYIEDSYDSMKFFYENCYNEIYGALIIDAA